jgi:phosphopantetheinyl transferase
MNPAALFNARPLLGAKTNIEVLLMIMETNNYGTAQRIFSVGLSLLPKSPKKDLKSAQTDAGRQTLKFLDRQSPTDAIIATEPLGRPYFMDRHADFSISHSGLMAAVSYCSDHNPHTGLPYRTGCDVEFTNPSMAPRVERLIRRFFASKERDYINDAETALEYQRRFYQIWTLKECFLKLKGLSILAIAKTPVFSLTGADGKMCAGSFRFDQENPADSPLLVFYLYELGTASTDRYILTVVRETNLSEGNREPKLCWLSQDILPIGQPIVF